MPFLSSSALGIAALLAATSAWGAMFLLGKDVLRHVDPFWFTLIRYSLSALVFAALLLPRGAAPWRRLRADAGALALRGTVGFGVFSVMLLTGLAHSQPSHGAVIMATTPISTQLLRWVLDGVRPGRITLAASALAMAGVVVVSGVLTSPHGAASTAYGEAIALAGTLGWVWYTRGATQFADRLDVLEYSALTVLASWPLLLAGVLGASALGLATLPEAPALQLSWHALLYVGLIPSAFAVLAYNFGVRALGPVTGTAFINFVPVSALLMGVALGHLPTGSEFAGMALVVGALLLHTAGSRTAARAAAPVAVPSSAQGRTASRSPCGATS